MSIVEWHADRIIADILDDCRQAIDEVTGECVPIGQSLVHVDTSLLQSRIAAVPAAIEGDTVTGAFGVPADPGYALPQEFLPEPQGKAFIRPAADQRFPTLPQKLAARRGGR